jgi:hypothetical protein
MSEGTHCDNFRQVNGIWLVETPPPEPLTPPPENTGPKCWQCDRRCEDGRALFGRTVDNWRTSAFTCRHAPVYYCPEHDYEWMRANKTWSRCPTCGTSDEYC